MSKWTTPLYLLSFYFFCTYSFALNLPASNSKQFKLLAGVIGGQGNIDGPSKRAAFNGPYGAAIDSVGNVYVTDTSNHTIRKISTAGVVTTFVGLSKTSGSLDGTGSNARFNNPKGITIDSSNNLYVADTNNYTIRKITPSGVVTTLAGSAGLVGNTNGTGSAARFNTPMGITVDSSGNLYVADYGGHTIRKITSGGVVSTLAGTGGAFGSTNATGSSARFNNPQGVAVDSSGNVFVTDTGNVLIRKITSLGVVTTFAGTASSTGSTDGTGAAARFNSLAGITIDTSGNLYIGDYGNRIVRKVTSAAVVTTLAGTAGLTGGVDGTGSAALFYLPAGVAVSSSGDVYVVDQGNSNIRKITSSGVVTTFAGSYTAGNSDGIGVAARFSLPSSMAMDSSKNLYVSDTGNNTIRKITPSGVVTTLAGLAGSSGNANGTGSVARFNNPRGLVIDSLGNLFVSDYGNHTIRKITLSGDVTTFAGTAGSSGTTDGTGAAARFNYPLGLAIDSSDNLYVADSGTFIMRKVTPAGVVTTLAGLAGSIGTTDGAGSAARLSFHNSMVVAPSGMLYMVDIFYNTVRAMDPAGVVTTIAGTANFTGGNIDGTGGAAAFASPSGIAVDASGNLYVADNRNYSIRKITPAGVVTTLTGSASRVGLSLGPLRSASFGYLTSIFIINNRMYIASDNSIIYGPKL